MDRALVDIEYCVTCERRSLNLYHESIEDTLLKYTASIRKLSSEISVGMEDYKTRIVEEKVALREGMPLQGQGHQRP